MFPQYLIKVRMCSLFIFCSLFALPAFSQQNSSPSQTQDENSVEGNVVASSHITFVVGSDDNEFHLFHI